MKNILIIIHHLCRGGSEHAACKLSTILSKEHNVVIATFIDPKFYPNTFEFSGIHMCLNQNPDENKVRAYINRYRFINKIIKTQRIDYTISFLSSADIINSFVSSKCRKIACIRSNVETLFTHKGIINIFWKYIYHKMNVIIFQTEINKLNFIQKMKPVSELLVIPNEYKITEIQSKSRESFFNNNWDKYFVLIQVARLYEIKGQWILFHILKELHSRGQKNARIVILGTGPLLEEYKQLCKELGLRAIDTKEDIFDFDEYDVIFKSFATNPHKYVAKANVFIFTSISEGFPNALAEAMINGKFSFVSDLDGVARLLFKTKTNESNLPLRTEYGVILPVIAEKQGNEFRNKLTVWVNAIEEHMSAHTYVDENAIQSRMAEFDDLIISEKWLQVFR